MTDNPVWKDAGPQWSGVNSITIIELVRAGCERYRNSPAMIFEDGLVVSYSELLERTEQFAGYLCSRVGRGDRVAIMLDNRAEFMIAWLAVVAVRATLVSINPASKFHDARHVLQDSGAVMAIIGHEHQDLVNSLRSDCPALREVVRVVEREPDGFLYQGSAVRPFRFSDAASARQDITNVYYTSGTTGPPKGCMVDHGWWLRTVDVLLRRIPRAPEDRQLCCLQFFYSDPPHQLLECLHTGGALVVMRRFSVSRFWDVVRDNRVTLLLTFSSMPVFLLKVPPSPRDREHRVRVARHLGMPPHLHREMVQRWGFPWLEGYGMTEANLISGMPLAYAEEMVGTGSIGIPVPEVSLRIVDESGNNVAPGEVGEFLVKGPGMFRGYLNRPKATDEVFSDGWLHTGDLGRADERGFLYFVGRSKDIIRRSGENLSAAEVEDVLRSHPKILDAAVIAVPDELRGEEVKAYILPVPGESEHTIPPDEIVEYCARMLAAYKVPRYIEYRTSDFPRTPSMRVRKELLRQGRPDLMSGIWDREKHAPNGRL